MRIGSRGWIQSEVINVAINIYPSAAFQSIFVLMNSAIVDGQTYIRRPVLVLGIIFKQAHQ